MRAARTFLFALPMLVLFTGCLGYQHGSLAHPELETIAIGKIANATDQPRLAFLVRQHLAEAITRDGSLRLVDSDEADCIIQADVRKFATRGVAETRVDSKDKDQRFNRTTAFAADLTVNWSVTLPSATRPLLKPRDTVGRAVYTEQFDFTTARDEGLRQAARDAAVQIVTEVTEGW